VTCGFECHCKACVGATPESEKLQEEIYHKFKSSCLCGSIFGSLDPLLELEKEIVKEGLDYRLQFLGLLEAIQQVNEKIDNIPWNISSGKSLNPLILPMSSICSR